MNGFEAPDRPSMRVIGPYIDFRFLAGIINDRARAARNVLVIFYLGGVGSFWPARASLFNRHSLTIF
jgi:hypothetical protein